MYPLPMKVPPATTKSVKGPPSIEISSTAPSWPLSKSKLCRKIKLAPEGLTNGGVSKVESVTQPGALWNTVLGGDEGSTALVAQSVPSAQLPPGVQLAGPGVKEEAQPAGRSGGVTVSKPSFNAMTTQAAGVGVAGGVGVAEGVGVGEGGVGVTVGGGEGGGLGQPMG